MPKKILVIDDEIGITKEIVLTAKQLGLECSAVTDPERAAERFADCRPDIVIIDMIMPGKDSITVLQEILTTGFRLKSC